MVGLVAACNQGETGVGPGDDLIRAFILNLPSMLQYGISTHTGLAQSPNAPRLAGEVVVEDGKHPMRGPHQEHDARQHVAHPAAASVMVGLEKSRSGMWVGAHVACAGWRLFTISPAPKR